MMSTDTTSDSNSSICSSPSTFDQRTNDRSLPGSLSSVSTTAGSTKSSGLVTLTAIFIASFLLLTGPSTQFGLQPRLITRFCYNSPNLSTINSQCVLCNYYTFDATLLGCTGSTALSVNITASQAFCVISQCLGQVRQSPVFLGRRRKREADGEAEVDHAGLQQQQHLEKTKTAEEEAGELVTVPRGFGNWSDRFKVMKEVNADVFFEEDDDIADE